MSKKNKLFISCEEAKHICDKAQYGEATLWERIKLTLRLSWCHITRAYTKKNEKLTKLVKESNVQVLEQEQKVEMQRRLHKEINRP